MTRLTYILLFFLPSMANAQIAPEVLPLLNEWKNEARKNEIYVDGIIAKHLGGVKFVTERQMDLLKRPQDTKITPAGIVGWEVKRGLYGYSFLSPVIFIQERYKVQENSLKFIIWHELYHFLGGKGHTKCGITGEQVIWIDWSEEQTEYWDQIKSLPVNAHWKKNDNTYY